MLRVVCSVCAVSGLLNGPPMRAGLHKSQEGMYRYELQCNKGDKRSVRLDCCFVMKKPARCFCLSLTTLHGCHTLGPQPVFSMCARNITILQIFLTCRQLPRLPAALSFITMQQPRECRQVHARDPACGTLLSSCTTALMFCGSRRFLARRCFAVGAVLQIKGNGTAPPPIDPVT